MYTYNTVHGAWDGCNESWRFAQGVHDATAQRCCAMCCCAFLQGYGPGPAPGPSAPIPQAFARAAEWGLLAAMVPAAFDPCKVRPDEGTGKEGRTSSTIRHGWVWWTEPTHALSACHAQHTRSGTAAGAWYRAHQIGRVLLTNPHHYLEPTAWCHGPIFRQISMWMSHVPHMAFLFPSS